ncbi:hypothetical protein ACQKWADRAFT_327144 [Trichoderma austrokoningii]
MSQSPLPAKLSPPAARPYPPCIFHTQGEIELYERLRGVYEEHGHTWDAESRDVWPLIVEHASLAPSTIGKLTNHYITRHMTHNGVTWAHVVALRIIYKKQLCKSRKLMGLIRGKYPNASFETFGFSQDYALSFKTEAPREAQEKLAPAVDSSALTKRSANNRHREAASKGGIEFLSEGDSSEDEPLMWKTKPAQSTTPKKRAAANDSGVELHKRSKKSSPRAGEAKEEETVEEQEDSIDIFDKFMRAIEENTKATRENTKAIKELRSRHSSKRATRD